MLFCLNTECLYINRSATVVVVVEAVATVVVVASGSLLIVVVGASPLFEDSVVVVVMLSLLKVVVVPMAWRSVFETKESGLQKVGTSGLTLRGVSTADSFATQFGS